MSEVRVTRRPDGGVLLARVPTYLAEVMRELPGLLDPDQPEDVRRRLFPDPTADDEEANREWRRAQVPELFALLASAREVVARDLAGLRRDRPALRGFRIEIPPAHVNAWISALNAARLTLGTKWNVDERDMEGSALPTPDERGLAIVRLDLMAWLQGMLIQSVAPEPPETPPPASPPTA